MVRSFIQVKVMSYDESNVADPDKIKGVKGIILYEEKTILTVLGGGDLTQTEYKKVKSMIAIPKTLIGQEVLLEVDTFIIPNEGQRPSVFYRVKNIHKAV